MTEARIARWVRDARICRRRHGVYTLGHAVLSIRGELIAALLYAGLGAALSHTTAAWWWGLLAVEPRRIHLSAPVTRVSAADLIVHRPRRLERVVHRGLPVTPVARTVLDSAASVSPRALRKLLAEVEFLGIVDLEEIDAAMTRGHPGSAALRRALAAHRPELARARSPLEERFVELCERYDVPMPRVNAEVCGFVVDAVWPDEGLVVELDGRAGHATAARMEADRRRDLALRAAGLDVWRYTWGQLTDSAPLIAEELKRRLA